MGDLSFGRSLRKALLRGFREAAAECDIVLATDEDSGFALGLMVLWPLLAKSFGYDFSAYLADAKSSGSFMSNESTNESHEIV